MPIDDATRILTREFVELTIASMFRRCDAARNAGGIAHMDVIDRRLELAPGWVLDPDTMYWLPENVVLL